MKNLMRIISVLLAFVGVVLVIQAGFNTGRDFTIFATKIALLFAYNILPIISIALCAYCLERNDNNYIIRIIPVYMCIPILITIIMAVFNIEESWLVNVYSFFSSTFLGITALSLIMVIKANNKITTTLKYIAIGILVLNVVLAIVKEVKSYMVDTLPNVYGYQNYGGFNFSTVEETNEFATKMYSMTSIGEIIAIILLFTTNYAFSDKIELETEDIDYEAVKNDALNVANKQMENLYSTERFAKDKEQPKPENTSNEKGLMNISNQLGTDSNVGTVSGQAKTVKLATTVDSFISLKQGPIENKPTSGNTTEQEVKEEKTPETIPETVPETTAPNLDIKEQMKMKVNQQNTQQTVQTPEQVNTTNQVSQAQVVQQEQQVQTTPQVQPQQNINQ